MHYYLKLTAWAATTLAKHTVKFTVKHLAQATDWLADQLFTLDRKFGSWHISKPTKPQLRVEIPAITDNTDWDHDPYIADLTDTRNQTIDKSINPV